MLENKFTFAATLEIQGKAMFKLFNDYPLAILLKKVRQNAIMMFVVYALFISAGIISAIMIAQNKHAAWMFLPASLGGGLLLPAPFLLYSYFSNKLDKYSLFTQEDDKLCVLDKKIRSCEKIGYRLGVSDEFIFSLKSSFYIPFALPIKEIDAVYFNRYWRKGWLQHSVNLNIITKDGSLYKLPLGYKLIVTSEKPLDEWILARIHVHAPYLLVGIKYGYWQTKNLKEIKPLFINNVKHS